MRSQGGFLLDTNVLSEMRKPRPDPNVLRFFENLSPAQTYVSVLTLAELRKGAALQSKRDLQAAKALASWIDGLEEQHLPRVLPVDLDVARTWGELSADRSRPIVDTLIAATAIRHRLTLVTRNLRDVEDTPAQLYNPWSPEPLVSA